MESHPEDDDDHKDHKQSHYSSRIGNCINRQGYFGLILCGRRTSAFVMPRDIFSKPPESAQADDHPQTCHRERKPKSETLAHELRNNWREKGTDVNAHIEDVIG